LGGNQLNKIRNQKTNFSKNLLSIPFPSKNFNFNKTALEEEKYL